MLLPDLLVQSAERSPEKTALIFPDGSISFHALHQQSSQVAARLRKLGVGPGTRLLVLVKEDRIVFMPEPRDYVKRFSGRHKALWDKGYLERERRVWRRR